MTQLMRTLTQRGTQSLSLSVKRTQPTLQPSLILLTLTHLHKDYTETVCDYTITILRLANTLMLIAQQRNINNPIFSKDCILNKVF